MINCIATGTFPNMLVVNEQSRLVKVLLLLFYLGLTGGFATQLSALEGRALSTSWALVLHFAERFTRSCRKFERFLRKSEFRG